MKKNSISCWNCGKNVKNFFFCEHCKKIQKPIEHDPFQLFSLPYEFNIDIEKLEADFFNLQHKLHPDKFINANENERLFSGIHSGNLNQSYHLLVDPISRAGILLKILINYDLKEKTLTDKILLFEIMELEEEKENLEQKKDALIFFKKIMGLIDDEIKTINNKFKEENYLEAAKIHTKLTYLKKIKNDFKKVEIEL